MAATGEISILTVAASIAGAVTAALRQGKWRLQRPTLADIVKSFVGGALMGVGVALIPGGNNSLILAAIPALSPGGTAAYLLMTATIVLGLSARARIFRKRTAASRRSGIDHSGRDTEDRATRLEVTNGSEDRRGGIPAAMKIILAAYWKTSSGVAITEDDRVPWSQQRRVRRSNKAMEVHHAVWKISGGDRSAHGGAAACHSGGRHRTPVHRRVQRPQGSGHLRGHRLRRASLRVDRQV